VALLKESMLEGSFGGIYVRLFGENLRFKALFGESMWKGSF